MKLSNDLPRVYDQIAFPLHAISINNSDYTVRTYFSSAHVGSRELLVVGSTWWCCLSIRVQVHRIGKRVVRIYIRNVRRFHSLHTSGWSTIILVAG
jgi:hypothetical protein